MITIVWIVVYFVLFPLIAIAALSYARGALYTVIQDKDAKQRNRRIHAMMGLCRVPLVGLALTPHFTSLSMRWSYCAIGWCLAVAIFAVDDNLHAAKDAAATLECD